jgi:hypothetical protein
MSYIIYCDLDGVLVNFVDGYFKLTGVDTSSKNVPGGDQFWAPVDREGPRWWANLHWMNDGKLLWDYIKKCKPYILSSPSRSNSSRVGKDAWVRMNLKPDYKSLLLYPRHEKQLFSKENHILIDDMANTIAEWNSKGGIGIHHTSAANTIKQLKELGL